MDLSDQPQRFLLPALEGFPFQVKESAISSVAHIQTVNAPKHLVVVGENEDLTWEMLRVKGVRRGDPASLADEHMEGILRRFANHLNMQNAAWRFEINRGEKSVTHLIIAHKNNFGPFGQIRRCTDDIRKPALIVEWAMQALSVWDAFNDGVADLFKKK